MDVIERLRALLERLNAEVDDARVVTTLHEHLDDFDRFRRALAGTMDDDGRP